MTERKAITLKPSAQAVYSECSTQWMVGDSAETLRSGINHINNVVISDVHIFPSAKARLFSIS